MDNKNYYDLLNVRPNASCREIHASYIRLLEEYKTDLNKTEEEDYFLKMAAKLNIAELEKAYAILSDAERILVRLSYHFSRTFSSQYNLQFYFILLFRSHPL